MVLEIARLTIAEGHAAEFESAFDLFKEVLAKAPGFHGAELRKCVERPSEYWLLVRWETVEAHTVDFKNAGGFARWDQLVGPHLAAPPDAVHGQLRSSVTQASRPG
ncbi:MAG TPA: antibiotic biosynthesis monooxygenase family protein [Acidimicrobiales bacterium]|nr:antibiotic biosynthesis monooxygenase family protein [Acidimicrobiales bacterium]